MSSPACGMITPKFRVAGEGCRGDKNALAARGLVTARRLSLHHSLHLHRRQCAAYQTVMRHRSHPRRTAVPCRDWMLTWRVFGGVVIGSIRYTSQLAMFD